MNGDDLDKKIQRQSFRKVPADWRAEILRTAQNERLRANESRPTFFSFAKQQLTALFWPNPKAWAGLAAVWIVIFAVQFLIGDHQAKTMAKAPPPSPELQIALRQQQELFTELIGARSESDAEKPKTFFPKPTSERRLELMCA
ncbi:MAG TPA: hypothetical protein VFM25_05260 [Verrucomicrobiae bacterium]|nr:hypothetical protein [Verrucomicrobiae bacterium]